MDINERQIDTGTAYGMKPATYNKTLVEVGPGTPMGELMRRYWQPVFVAEDLTSDRPRRVRILGEDLILFRDKEGRPGLVHEHCTHRGTSLYYGRIEEDGIRCCYHGWKFSAEGHCLDQPCEVNRGEQNRHRVRQPWYPVVERYGLVFAYMGPPEKKPAPPSFAHLENLAPGEIIEVRTDPGVGPKPKIGDNVGQPFNWLQTFENTMDAPHLPWLHYHHSGDQFIKLKLIENQDKIPPYARFEDMAASMIVKRTELGVTQGAPMTAPDGTRLFGCNEAMIPNKAYVPGFIDLLYFVPADDTNTLTFFIYRSQFRGQRTKINAFHNGKLWDEMAPEEHQAYPGDYEAQSSIGELPSHNREHLSQGDVALVMLRRRLEEAVQDVVEGRDPPGVVFDPAAPPLQTSGHPLRPMAVEA